MYDTLLVSEWDNSPSAQSWTPRRWMMNRCRSLSLALRVNPSSGCLFSLCLRRHGIGIHWCQKGVVNNVHAVLIDEDERVEEPTVDLKCTWYRFTTVHSVYLPFSGKWVPTMAFPLNNEVIPLQNGVYSAQRQVRNVLDYHRVSNLPEWYFRVFMPVSHYN